MPEKKPDEEKQKPDVNSLGSFLTKADGTFNLLKALAASLGLSGVSIGILYLLFAQILELEIFSQLDQVYTFVFLLVLVFLITSVVLYVLSNKFKQVHKKFGINFEVPENAMFEKVVFGIAKSTNRVVSFEGFSDAQKRCKLRNYRIEASTLESAIMRLKFLVKDKETLPDYTVKEEDGLLTIKVD